MQKTLIIALLLFGGVVGGLSFDASGDGLRVYEDIIHQTDPLSTDTDDDDLTDYDEIKKYETDPTNPDTDDDKLNDYEEIHDHGTNPRTPYTVRPMTDYEEVVEYGTDPTTADTDGDGVKDSREVKRHDTDPHDPDTDGDNLTDDEELNEYETKPTVADTDEDGLNDGAEVNKYGTDPHAQDSRGTGMQDDLAVEVLIDSTEDPLLNETEKLQPYFEADNNIYNSRPISKLDIKNDGPDSSGDGFSDKFSRAEPNLTADEIDVFVEVGYMENATMPISSLLRMQQAFDEAPITNTQGEEVGINLHFYIHSEPNPRMTAEAPHWDMYESLAYQWDFEGRGYGFYHMFIVEDVYNPDTQSYDVEGLTISSSDGMLVESNTDSKRAGSMAMHELGHQLGLWEATYSGIDTEYKSAEEYPSVMNYNVDEFTYSDGPGHDDWSYIEDNIRRNHPLNWMLNRTE